MGQPQKGTFIKEVAFSACSPPLFKAQGACHELCIIFVMRLLKRDPHSPPCTTFKERKCYDYGSAKFTDEQFFPRLQGTHSKSIHPLPKMPLRAQSSMVYITCPDKFISLVLEVYLCYQKKCLKYHSIGQKIAEMQVALLVIVRNMLKGLGNLFIL